MELKDKNTAASDDEDDLEKLRLAALQSLRRTVLDEPKNHQKKSPQNLHKRRHFQGRNIRNGQFYNRPKNTNLISIPTVDDESVSDIKPPRKHTEAAPKLILPQDRYCTPQNEEKPTEPASKFDRYDNSDKSESESECEEASDSESESRGKLEKSDSLEALMQELENEIQGDTKPKEPKEKKTKKRKVKTNTPVKIEEKEEIKEVKDEIKEEIKEIVQKNESEKQEKKGENIEKPTNTEEIKIEPKKGPKFRNIERKRSPLNKRFYKKNFDRNTQVRNAPFRQHYAPPAPIFPENSFGPSLPFNPIIPFNNILPNQPLVPLSIPPNYLHRPPSPLNLTEDVLTIARAPLSPRSAAFVLQNREIIERRKKSPRRSYSRSPSPRYRRSKSPPYRRSLSPRKFVKSKSRSPHPIMESNKAIDLARDRRTSPPLDRRISPKTSPIRDRRSPIRKLSPPRQRYPERKSPNLRRTPPKQTYKNSPKTSVRERLGTKNRQEIKEKSQSPEVKEEKIEEKPSEIDPVLEARRKKFETNEIKNTEGIIRLKPKAETKEENGNVVNVEENQAEEDLLDLLSTNVDDIFSDEETDEENEGRFKSNINTQRNVSVLPFTQLVDDTTKNIKTETTKSGRVPNRKRQRSRSPSRNYKERSKESDTKRSKLYARNRVLFRNGSSRKEKLPVTAPIENKKIEIKIRNPSKYETTTSKYDVANEHEIERVDKLVRKVVEEIKKEPELENNDSVANTDKVDDDKDNQLKEKCEGDLRAQLSRKRAERQNKLPVPEDVQSRLLQNALQGAVFKKPKKSRKEKDAAPKDGKLPIHLRLGFANSMEIFQEPKVKRKRSKSKGRIEQV